MPAQILSDPGTLDPKTARTQVRRTNADLGHMLRKDGTPLVLGRHDAEWVLDDFDCGSVQCLIISRPSSIMTWVGHQSAIDLKILGVAIM